MGEYATIPVKNKTKKRFVTALTKYQAIDGERLTEDGFIITLLNYFNK